MSEQMKTIMPDAAVLYRYGLRNLVDVAILIYVARAGLVGVRIGTTAEALGLHGRTVDIGFRRLKKLRMITKISESNKQGRPHNYVVTVGGWKLLTEPASYAPYVGQQTEI